MKSFTTLKKSDVTSIALGGFDGIHIAHKKLISHLDINGALVIIDRGGIGLTPHKYRCQYTTQKGCFFLKLREIKSLSADSFVRYLKEEFINLKKIVVGYDFRFAKDREGDIKLLRSLFDGEVIVLDEVLYDDISVHSRTIKELYLLGNVDLANRLLGRLYSINAKVIKGQGLGKKELFATLNLDCGDFFIPKPGVYATYATINNKIYKSATFIGNRLSTDNNFSVETHIIDKNIIEEIEILDIEFISYIRENRKFDTLPELKSQIKLDIADINSMLQ